MNAPPAPNNVPSVILKRRRRSDVMLAVILVFALGYLFAFRSFIFVHLPVSTETRASATIDRALLIDRIDGFYIRYVIGRKVLYTY